MADADRNGKEWVNNSEALDLACRALPSYCMQQRWYPAKDRGVSEFSLSELLPLQRSAHAAALAVWNVTVEGRKPFQLFIPLAVIPHGEQRRANLPIIGRLQDGRLVVDALECDSFIKEFVSLTLPDSGAASSHLQTGYADPIAALRNIPVSQWRIKRSSVEQSNTSIRVCDMSILKVIRKIAPGIHPELEMARFLTDQARFRATPALMGWINLDENTIAILQEFIPNEGDGWTWVQAQLQAGTVDSDKALQWLAILGRSTAELHQALNIASDDEAFKPEIAGREDWQRWSQDLSAMSARVREALVTREADLDSKTRRLAARFHESVQGLDDWLLSWVRSSPRWQKTRHHGDYHLGQVLVCGDAAVIVDFEGEPMRSLDERRAKHVPLRDVAGMLRSIQYASAVAQRELPAGMTAEQRSNEVKRLNKWSAGACQVFTESYLKRLGDGSAEPIDRATATRIVQFFLIEKGLYEVLYELSNRPEWAAIPLQGVISQFEQVKQPLEEVQKTNTRRHPMPFGAETQPEGGTRFRIWAPACPELAVAIRSAEGKILRTLKMSSLEGGWHEVVDAAACAGTLYDYVLPDGTHIPDPASRFQPHDIHGPSEVIDPNSFQWSDSWGGRGWEEAVIYEVHVGTFTPAGTFRAAIERLDHLVALGVSAIELMPIADFPGKRNWGYDGVLWYAPDSSYGRPEDLKSLIEAAHARNIMVLLDVVYNHFGPDGNWLPACAPEFFTDRHKTPWGAAVNYDGPHAHTVREFVIQNALYWLEEYNLDGLRLDAVHAILDDSPRHVLEELAQRVRTGRFPPVHLVLENEDNSARWLSRSPAQSGPGYDAQWNDDVHHVLHVAATGETQGYYADYVGETQKLGRALAEGFVFQGETMPFSGRRRGEPSDALPPSSFVAFIQNHDQIGNRAFGDRITQVASSGALRAIAAVYLLLPQIPMLFMGEEWGSKQPFPFFCDFDGDLAKAVVRGRREEFAKFPEFQDEFNREKIPDPQAESTFLSAKLRWEQMAEPEHAGWLDFYRRVLALRRAQIVPNLKKIRRGGRFDVLGVGAARVNWHLDSGGRLLLEANLSNAPVQGFNCTTDGLLWLEGNAHDGELSPWSVRWSLSWQVS